MAPPLSLKARALQWLAQREHSRAELRRKLLRAARQQALRQRAELAARDSTAATATATAAFVPDDPHDDTAAHDHGPVIDALLDWLAAHRYLSEARFVESRVHARAARFGQRRIAQELAQHGASLDEATASRLAATEFDRARAVWQRKFAGEAAADAAGRARQMRFLAGRGFSADVIRRVVRGGPDDGLDGD